MAALRLACSFAPQLGVNLRCRVLLNPALSPSKIYLGSCRKWWVQQRGVALDCGRAFGLSWEHHGLSDRLVGLVMLWVSVLRRHDLALQGKLRPDEVEEGGEKRASECPRKAQIQSLGRLRHGWRGGSAPGSSGPPGAGRKGKRPLPPGAPHVSAQSGSGPLLGRSRRPPTPNSPQ